MQAFSHKVALITGASSGIGRATAIRLAQLGADVALLARNPERLQETAHAIDQHGRRAVILPCDVTEKAQVQHAIARTIEHFHQLDILICSAGVSMRSHFAQTQLDAIDHVMQVNFFGTLYATWHALPHIKATRGSLVALSSLVGKRGTPTYAVYGASKFAVQGLYESLRVELAPEGVHVGIVSPGHVQTPLRESVLGPDGLPWKTPPTAPFRVWPVEKIVDRVVQLIVKRQAEALIPGFVGSLLTLDRMLGPALGDRFIRRQFRKYPLPEQ
jgi:NAD(P)-dependent dehydrogenase (short-subunit alcohol dehydrogenase family)